MENISKALLISVGTLIAILIIAIATRVFNSASQVSKTYYSKQEIEATNVFNSNFTKYVGAVIDNNTGQEKQKLATIYDIISVANFAKDYNNDYDVTGPDDPRILRVNIQSAQSNANSKKENIQDLTAEKYNTLTSKCYYTNNSMPNSNSIITFEIEVEYNAAGRINKVTFYPINEYSNHGELVNTLKNL